MQTWQSYIGILGILLWMATIFNGEEIIAFDSKVLTGLTSGYVFAFVMAFVGFVIWRTPTGTIRDMFVGKSLFENLHTGVMIGFLSIMAFFCLMVTISGMTPWPFNVGAALAGFIVHQGVGPLINGLDGH